MLQCALTAAAADCVLLPLLLLLLLLQGSVADGGDPKSGTKLVSNAWERSLNVWGTAALTRLLLLLLLLQGSVADGGDPKSGTKLVSNAWERSMSGALQLYTPYGPGHINGQNNAAATAAISSSSSHLDRLRMVLTQRLLPALMWQVR
jgi:hypothetical protein